MVALGMRGIILAGILATTALVAVCMVLLSSTSWGAQESSSSTTGASTNKGGSSCSADEWQEKTFTGTQDQSTPQFVIVGPKWRVIIHARATGSGVGRVTVSAQGDDGQEIEVGSVSAPPHERLEGPSVSSDLIDGPGIFNLDIEAEDAEYAVRVCERQVRPSPPSPSSSSSNELGSEPPPQPPSPPSPPARTTPAGKGETSPEESAAQPPPPPPPARPPPPAGQPQPSFPSPAPGLNSGGAPPVRLMPNGGCPKEFPVKKGGACFLR